MSEYVAPTFKLDAYHCPHCGVYSYMKWSVLFTNVEEVDNMQYTHFLSATCSCCSEQNIWKVSNYVTPRHDLLLSARNGTIIYPDSSIVSEPSKDMPDDVKQDYIEAASIYQKSPRGAVALLRLGLQKLCIHLGGKGEKINDDLATLAKDEIISKKLIKSADIIRIVGNNAVHPGTISDDDFDDVSFKLFKLTNMIVQQGITESREVDEIFSTMPENARKAAEDRDKPKSK